MHNISKHVLRCTLYPRRPVKSQDVLVRSTDQHTTWTDCSCWHPDWTNKLPHVDVNCCTFRCIVLYYTVVPTYTRRNILKRNTVLCLYTSKMISDILAKVKQIIFHYSKLSCRKYLLLQQQQPQLLLLLLQLLGTCHEMCSVICLIVL